LETPVFFQPMIKQSYNTTAAQIPSSMASRIFPGFDTIPNFSKIKIFYPEVITQSIVRGGAGGKHNIICFCKNLFPFSGGQFYPFWSDFPVLYLGYILTLSFASLSWKYFLNIQYLISSAGSGNVSVTSTPFSARKKHVSQPTCPAPITTAFFPTFLFPDRTSGS